MLQERVPKVNLFTRCRGQTYLIKVESAQCGHAWSNHLTCRVSRKAMYSKLIYSNWQTPSHSLERRATEWVGIFPSSRSLDSSGIVRNTRSRILNSRESMFLPSKQSRHYIPQTDVSTTGRFHGMATSLTSSHIAVWILLSSYSADWGSLESLLGLNTAYCSIAHPEGAHPRRLLKHFGGSTLEMFHAKLLTNCTGALPH